MSKNEKKNPSMVIGLWIGVFALIFIAIIGLAIANRSKSEQKKDSGSSKLSVEVGAADHVRGSPLSRIILVEYSDFQCPACGAYYPIVKKVDQEYGNRVQIVYRNFPLVQLHKYAYVAAQAAEAAGKQRKFFEMHDLLFEHQSEWPELPDVRGKLIEYADSLKLDRTVFEKDMESKEVKEKIDTDLKSGQSSGVQGTPTFYLNGKKIDNPRSYDEFKQAIDAAIENSK